jgi:23S rRNA (adenine2030-N6)-methyltransferase
MFSYRHGFHAGNHADVLKHLVQVLILEHLAAKDKPFWVIDTHAGGGSYRLDEGYAAKSLEYETGIARLWDVPDLPVPLRSYIEDVRRVNPDGQLKVYPGSPQISLQHLRTADRLHVFEKHPTEIGVLQEYFRTAGRQVTVHDQDGYAGLKALLPPPPRRALVLIDPSYEDKNDYDAVVEAMGEALKRFAIGTYAVWYPQVQRAESHQLPQRLQALAPGDWMHAALTVKAPGAGGLGLHGSGMFVFNPPWKLERSVRDALPTLVRLLGQDGHATSDLYYRNS